MQEFLFNECVKTLQKPDFTSKLNIIINPIIEVIFSKINVYIYITLISVIFILILLLINLIMLIHIVRK